MKTDSEEFIRENVCSIKNYECCNDSCEHCSNTNNISDVLNVLENVYDVSYARWVRRDDRY